MNKLQRTQLGYVNMCAARQISFAEMCRKLKVSKSGSGPRILSLLKAQRDDDYDE